MEKIKVKDIVNYLHKIANPGLAYDWDNVGFQLGDAETEVKKILLTLDVTANAINKAIDENANLIISHHPFIFRPIKNITNPLLALYRRPVLEPAAEILAEGKRRPILLRDGWRMARLSSPEETPWICQDVNTPDEFKKAQLFFQRKHD